jgi:UDP-N-acetylglucosamine acyltransferase
LKIHSTALIEDGAIIGANCDIGPFAHIGSEVVLGDNSIVMSHAVITGATTIGEGAKIYHHAVLGGEPQNTAHKGGRTKLTIGKNCTIREGVTMNRGTDLSRAETKVGDDCMFLAYSHVAHDCILGNRVTFANNVMIGGHCEFGDGVIVGGGGAIHQFCRVGNNAFIGGMAGVTRDVIPFGMAIGNHAHLAGLNIVGMKRGGLPRSDIHAMRHAYKMLFDRNFTLHENIERVREAFPDAVSITRLIEFVSVPGKRSYCTPPLDQKSEVSDDDGDD